MDAGERLSAQTDQVLLDDLAYHGCAEERVDKNRIRRHSNPSTRPPRHINASVMFPWSSVSPRGRLPGGGSCAMRPVSRGTPRRHYGRATGVLRDERRAHQLTPPQPGGLPSQ